MSPQRRCIQNGCPEYAVPNTSRCRRHTGSRWHTQPAARTVAYLDAEYRRNRKIAIEREPECHWHFSGCTGKSTTADHLRSVAQGGGHELENLVGACARCNHLRGSSLGGVTAKRRAAQRRQR
jgi:5-methylcytosine-specific restriction endonuclease McrA